jgi:Fe-Mn family superoxide dismutase
VLEDVIRDAAGSKEHDKLFNNAAQAWNHAFFWLSMTPRREVPQGDLAIAIEERFGGLSELRTAFVSKGAGHFGSGWLWLTAGRDGKLKVRATHDAEDPLTEPGATPLLVCDLWEHAYYLDYQNDRKAYLEAWFDGLPHWEFAAYQFAAARGRGQAWRYPIDSGAAQSNRASHG